MENTQSILDEVFSLLGEQIAVLAKGIPKEDAAEFAERKKRIEALLKQASDAPPACTCFSTTTSED